MIAIVNNSKEPKLYIQSYYASFNKPKSNTLKFEVNDHSLHFLSICGNWIEIAYGTSSGTVRVIVQHPETVGQGPQLFQTFTVHR